MLDKDPLVSIIIPAYNAENYIGDAIKSLINQTYTNLEIIVVNDGSTDGTEKIVHTIRDPRLKIINQKNKGQCAANNCGFKASSGELIKFFDADDILNPENIELQVRRLNGDFEYIASSEWGRFYNNDITTFRLNPESIWRDMQPIDWIIESLSTGSNMMQCAIWLIPRIVLNRSGLWDERLSLNNDFEFFVRVLLSCQGIKFTTGARLFYRSGIEGSLSNTFNREKVEAAVLSNRLGVEKILSIENSPRTRRACANALQTWAFLSYPEYSDITKELEIEIRNLGGSNIAFPEGPLLNSLSIIFGWKQRKKIHRIFNRWRYKK